MAVFRELVRQTRVIGSFVLFAGRRFGTDRCQVVAASLSYTSLLALVPMLAVILSVLAVVPQFVLNGAGPFCLICLAQRAPNPNSYY